mmetsp:Transcript_75228/g.244649  ORF Transcript_75228/g.244649 Transcript_75228/m.244649 type:complete len:337 (+) Transcript_75228:827-1837(+)
MQGPRREHGDPRWRNVRLGEVLGGVERVRAHRGHGADLLRSATVELVRTVLRRGTLHAQAVRQADQVARRRLLDRHNHITMPLQLDLAQVLQALILKQLRKLGIAESRLAQLDLELRTEEALDVGERERLVCTGNLAQQRLQAPMHHVPSGDRTLPSHSARAWPLALRIFLLHHRLRAAVRNDRAVQVAQQLLLRNRQLNNVADLSQRSAPQKGQIPLYQHLSARVPAAWQDHRAVVHAAEVLRREIPELLRVDVLGAVDVHEGRGTTRDQCRPIGTLHIVHLQPSARLAHRSQLLDADIHLLACSLRLLTDPLPEDAAVGLELVLVEALHGCRNL